MQMRQHHWRQRRGRHSSRCSRRDFCITNLSALNVSGEALEHGRIFIASNEHEIKQQQLSSWSVVFSALTTPQLEVMVTQDGAPARGICAVQCSAVQCQENPLIHLPKPGK